MACVRCAGEHRAADCTRPRDMPATCANCGGPHPACHSSCPVRKEEEQNQRAGTFSRTGPSRPLRQRRNDHPQDNVSHPAMGATPAVAPSTSGVAPTGDVDDFVTVRRRTRRGGRRRGRAPPSLAAQEASRAAALHAVTTDVAYRAAAAATTLPPPRSRTRSRALRPQMEEALAAIANILQAVQAGDNLAPLFMRAASALKGPTRGRSRRQWGVSVSFIGMRVASRVRPHT
ncbi:unnamed protein product [Pieris macdunnoughi]|nr:unnamed protein product [Pieris macdunnoughi]